MSDTTLNNPEFSALFANLVMQNASMAMIFLGHTPHPETGKTEINLEHARVFIDTLEMLQNKTRGNLDQNEDRFLNQNLMSLRMAYVEAVNHGTAPQAPASGKPSTTCEPTSDAKPAGPPADAESESHKKFTKKY